MSEQKRSIADLAHISTLSEEELEAINSEDSAVETYEEEETEGMAAAGDSEDGEQEESPAAPWEKKTEFKKPRLVHTEPIFITAAKPDARNMFDFMMYHTYRNVAGIASVLLGVGAIVALVLNIINKGEILVSVMLGVIILMFLANSPVTIWHRAKKQAELIAQDANTITYTFSPVGLDMSRGTEYASYEWSRVEKIIEVKNSYYFYLTKNSAFVIPKEDITENPTGFRRLLENSSAKKIKLMETEA